MIRRLVLFFILTLTGHILAQSTDKSFKPSGKPIVQVFGTAAYDFENNTYGYSLGRAHLGFQYQFDKKWSAKIIH